MTAHGCHVDDCGKRRCESCDDRLMCTGPEPAKTCDGHTYCTDCGAPKWCAYCTEARTAA